MNKLALIICFLAIAAYAQQKSIAVAEIADEGQPSLSSAELSHLGDRVRSIAAEILPQKDYLVALGPDESSYYTVQSLVGRFGGAFTIKMELRERESNALVGFFTDNSNDILGLLAVINEKAPIMFKKLPMESAAVPPVPVATAVPAVPEAASTDSVAAAEPAPKAAAVYTGSNSCHKEIFDLPKNNIQAFMKDLGVSVAKVKASCKTKFTCPADNKVMEVGLTAGCIKQLPASPAEIADLLKSIGLDLAADAALDLAAESPAIIESNIEKAEKSDSGSFWVAFTFDFVSAGLIAYGYFVKNKEVDKFYDEYRNNNHLDYDAKWKKVEDAKSSRNMFYIIGGVVCAAGIGVHIWF